MAGSSKDELELLERVFLRVASAETDEQLERTVGTFLSPLLLKVASPHQDVKNKVVTLLTHLNKRLKSRPKIQLPVKSLLLQYQDASFPVFVSSFSILYLKMGFPRLATEAQVELAPMMINCLYGKPSPQQDCLLQLVLPVLGHIKIPDSTEGRLKMFQFREKSGHVQLLLDFLLDVLLMPYSTAPRQCTTAGSGSDTVTSEQSLGSDSQEIPPAMSEAALKRIRGDSPLEAHKLEQVKLGTLKFLASDLFQSSEVICHFLVATGDTRHSVVDAGDRELKRRIASSTDFENPKVVDKIIRIFQGTVLTPGLMQHGGQIPSELKRSPASIRLKQKLFPYLLRSRRAADQFPACLQIIFDSLFGKELNSKLRLYAVQFVHHVCQWSSDKVMATVGPVLLTGMTKLMEEDKQDPKLRRLAYTAIGKLAMRIPQLFCKDIALIQRLFQALCEEESETRLAVQEALSMMAPSYKNADSTTLAFIEALILNYVERDTHQARLVAVQFANAVFPSTHISSRYVCLLAVADHKDDVKEEARRGLRFSQGSDLTSTHIDKIDYILPVFPELVSFVAQKSVERLRSKSHYTAGSAAIPFTPLVYAQVLLYLQRCLEQAAGLTEENRIKNCILPSVAPYIQKLLSGLTTEDFPTSPLGKYMELIKEALVPIGGADLHAVALCCLLQVVSVSPEKLAEMFHDQLDWIKSFTYSSRDDARRYAGQLFAVVICSMNKESFVKVIKELSKSVDSQLFEVQLGTVSTLGFVIARQIYNEKSKRKEQQTTVVEDMEVEFEDAKFTVPDLLSDCVEKIVKLVSSRNALISLSACNAIGEIGRNGPLPLSSGAELMDQDEFSSDEKEVITKLSVVEKLLDILQNAKDNKLKEHAAHALGFLLVGEEDFPHHKKLIDGLCESSQIRQVELHFTVGEALSCAGAGRQSDIAQDPWVVEQLKSTTCSGARNTMQELIGLIITKYSTSLIPYVRQASCIWLLSLVKYSGAHEVVQANLKEIQMVFMNMLGEANEITQEVASKGLGLVYEHGGGGNKDELVSMLVNTLMAGRRRNQSVVGDTKIFEEGELGKTPEGSSLSTYRELCSMATDLNQPDLIYKFMHLANHNALWNSRKGAAFGFSSIAAHSREQLEPYLPEIVPKLFRYQYDPDTKIQQAMASIWAALVPETKKTVDKYVNEILQDLMTSLGSNIWRVRQSSCMALSDLLSGRSVDDMLESLPRLWELSFRARDDIKESVRQSAEVACRTLSKVSIRICDVNQGKLGETAIALILPTLLHKGMTDNSAEEVRKISISTIVKISKNAGALLKPHIPLLVIALLESLSGLENQSMNYVSLQLHKSEEAQEKLEGFRIAASKTSPMMETINMCVQYVDGTVLPDLVPRLADLLRSGVGLRTKAGSASLVVSLSMHCSKDLTIFAGKLLNALLSGLSDRSPSVRRSYATAIGHLVKVAKDSSVEKLIDKIGNWYFEKEDEGLRLACGLTLQAISRYSSDVMKRHAAKALPAVFFAMNEKKNKQASGDSNSSDSIWDEIWLENTPGTEAGIRLYLEEIVSITCNALTSKSWTTKAQAAATISIIAKKLGSSLSQPYLDQLLCALVSGLAGRTWTGKEALLSALSCVCVNCRKSIEESTLVDIDIEKILDATFKECRKENPTYKMAALKCFGEIVQDYSIDRFQQISELLFPIIAPEPKDEEEEENEPEDEEEKQQVVNQEFLVAAFDCLGQSWPKNAAYTQDNHAVRFCLILKSALSVNTWKVQVVLLAAIKSFVERMDWTTGVLDDEGLERNHRIEMLRKLLAEFIPPVCESLEVKKYAAVRLGAVEVLEAVHSALQGNPCRFSLLSDDLKEHVLDSLKYIYSDKEPKIRDKATELKRKLLSNGS
ncbi:proteasome adapter and scaffold protein ECM29-like isoform X2 [Acropora millepora]|uniref:proteasome adapter and scaffold protein ECM29-like isoform X2 n=1 Tax=Acropora millepora TaxID=45264 RepID=UPI001CF3ADE6|nr:proteasome adapter and scaffold protein ECM29-like isoform X2 [Acropora millepora]